MHGDFNAADRAANAPMSAPVTPPVRSQEGRPAPSTPEKLPEHGQRQGVVHVRVEPERELKVRVASRKNEVKQQQDWRQVFVDRPKTEPITDCSDELVFGENTGYDKDLLSRSICASGSGCLSEVTRYVCERSRQDQNWAWRAWLSALLKRRCLLTVIAADAQVTTRNAAASTKGGKRLIGCGNFDVLITARCRMGFDRCAM